MTARIPCCVPFCKATFARSKPHDNDEEVICTAHMRPVSTNLKKLHRIAVKRAMEIMDRHPNTDDMPADEVYGRNNAPFQSFQRHGLRGLAEHCATERERTENSLENVCRFRARHQPGLSGSPVGE